MSAILNITGSLGAGYNVSESGLTIFGQGVSSSPSLAPRLTYVNGLLATANAWDLHFEDFGPSPFGGRTLAPAATEIYTLSALTDQINRSIPFLGIRGFVIAILARQAGDYLTIGPNSLHGWTGLIASGTIRVYDFFGYGIGLTDFMPVTSGSNDQFLITNAGSHNITYAAGFVGCSA